MPVPAAITDLSTTPGSNYPAGSETPTEGDNYIRTLSAFIAQLRDMLNGTSSATSLTLTANLTANGNVVLGDATSDTLTINATTTANGYIDTPNAAAFSAYRSSSQTLPLSTVTTCIFDTEAVDRAGAYNNATGIFTAPRTGLYLASAVVGIQNNTVSGGVLNGGYISKNDLVTVGNAVFLAASVARGSPVGAAGNAFDCAGSAVLSLTAGDTLRVKVEVGVGANLTMTAFSTFSVTYLG
jgi:hypothetical protein